MYDSEVELYYLQSRYYGAGIGRFINADAPEMLLEEQGSLLQSNLYAYCGNNPVNNADSTGYIAANVVGAVIGAVIGIVGGAFLGNWLADRIGLGGWKRWLFVGSVSVLVGATAAAIGYVIGPYVAKFAVKLGQYVLDLLQKGKIAFQKLSSNAKSAIRAIGKTACFIEGTPVLTDKGKVPIETISPGDLVWSENPETGESGYKPVVQIFINSTDTLVTVKTETQEIVTTNEHPFWVVGNGWTSAESLKTGDKLKLKDGSSSIITEIEIQHIDTPVTVYNFEVEDWHTYFVGEEPLLVHNQCARDFAKAARKSKDVVKYLKNNGFRVVSQNGSHIKLTDGIKTTIVPNHAKDIGKGLLIEILKQAGLW